MSRVPSPFEPANQPALRLVEVRPPTVRTRAERRFIRGSTPHEVLALREFVAGRDFPCPRCGHNLRGIMSANCPECGVPLRVELVTPLPSRRAFVIGVAALASGFFFNATLILFLLWERFSDASTQELWRVGKPQIVSALGFAIALPWWVVAMRWLDQQGRFVRVLLAACCWVVAFASAMWIHRVVR